jgi:hypothetical protein
MLASFVPPYSATAVQRLSAQGKKKPPLFSC